MSSLAVYGFGSFFDPASKSYSDVDLLLVHKDCALPSIQFAIRCKSLIRKLLSSADVVMLSESEENELGFIRGCRAIYLDTVFDSRQVDQIGCLVSQRLASTKLKLVTAS